MFGKPLPNFNIKGRDHVNTIAGGFLSMILYGVVLLYGAIKFGHLVSKHNPQIATYLMEDSMADVVTNLN